MPRLNLKKKLNPATKAWKSFTTKLQAKLQKLLQHSIPTAVIAASRSLPTTLSSFLPPKFRAISNPSTPGGLHYHVHSHHTNPNPSHQNLLFTNNHNMAKSQPLYHRSFTAIRVDELFDHPLRANIEKKIDKNNPPRITNDVHGIMEYSSPGTSQNRGEDCERGVGWGRGRSEIHGVEEAWRAVVAASPQLRCVDERAEEFIFKVRQDMRLQKEKSNLEFQEMLARGA